MTKDDLKLSDLDIENMMREKPTDHRSLKKRFEGHEPEVLKRVETFGFYEACDFYKVTAIPMHNWLKEKTGNENYGFNPTMPYGITEIVDLNLEKFLDYVLDKLAKKESEITRLQAELSHIQRDNRTRKAQESLLIEPKLMEVMKVLKNE